ncbi:hypothetical protein CB1_000438002 [Camelus ferus]|nr:hypothetical protein CB1_000438002 [Camelus ferus]
MSLNRGTKLAESQVTRRTALLLLGFWAMLAPVQCSQGHPSWRYISSEVVIPRKELHHGKGVQMPGWLSYSLYFGGQRHVMHMKSKNIFWPGQLLLLTQDEQGALQMDFPFIPSDCYHLGYVEGIPFSMVTVDTCYGGLEGVHSHVLGYQMAQLHVGCAGGHAPGQGDPALELVCIAYVTIFGLSPRLHQLDLRVDTCAQETELDERQLPGPGSLLKPETREPLACNRCHQGEDSSATVHEVRVQVQVQEELQEQAQGLPAGLVELGPVLGLLREQAQPLLASMVFPHLALGLLLD